MHIKIFNLCKFFILFYCFQFVLFYLFSNHFILQQPFMQKLMPYVSYKIMKKIKKKKLKIISVNLKSQRSSNRARVRWFSKASDVSELSACNFREPWCAFLLVTLSRDAEEDWLMHFSCASAQRKSLGDNCAFNCFRSLMNSC